MPDYDSQQINNRRRTMNDSKVISYGKTCIYLEAGEYTIQDLEEFIAFLRKVDKANNDALKALKEVR
jgi:hypothetical protein